MLRAELSVEPAHARRPEEIGVRARLVNDGEETVRVHAAALSSPSLALELLDDEGEPALLPPPPVPGAGEEAIELEPGAELPVEFPVFVPSWFEPGRYRVRLRYVAGDARVHSDWAQFELERP